MSPGARIPQHVAIIMDGNGRWAERRSRPRVFGHIRGASRVKSVVETADKMGVKVLTLFAFSTENWSRPDAELNVLWTLLKKFLRREVDQLEKMNVRLRVIGEVERLPEDVREVLAPAVAKLSNNTGLQLVFAVSYGSRRELIIAMKRFAEDCLAGKASPDAITEDQVEKYLWTQQLGALSNVDLLIRTSGEKRISNFLLWQCAYAEMIFTDTCWPDFSGADLKDAIQEFGGRERRFGLIATQRAKPHDFNHDVLGA